MTTKTPQTTKAPKTPKKRKKHFFVMPVNSFLSAFLCVGGLVSSGWVSLHVAELKQDRTVTVEQILARRKEAAEHIKNNPNMPAQAKAMALAQLGQTREMAPKQEPPQPNRDAVFACEFPEDRKQAAFAAVFLRYGIRYTYRI